MPPNKPSSSSSTPAAGSGSAMVPLHGPLRGRPPLRQPAPPVPATGVSLGLAGLLLSLGAVLLAAAAAWCLVLWLGISAPWAAALAAATGVAVASLPLGWMLAKLARALPPAGGSGADAASAVAGLPRALFIDLAGREFARARRYGSGAAVLLVDVDRHARLCEARGFSAGEAVLDDLLHHTAPGLRPSDLLTRLSDTQVAIFLAHADPTGALDVAERIRERAEQREVLVGGTPGAGQADAAAQRLRITVSIGVAQLRPAHLHLQALLDDADDAVIAARQAGGNCVRAAPVDVGRVRTPGGLRAERRGAKPKPAGPGA